MRLLIALLFLLIGPGLALAQVIQPPPDPRRLRGVGATREFLAREGFGDSTPLAQTTFRQGYGDKLCVDLGLKRGPGSLAKSFFTFSQTILVDGKTHSTPVKVAYDKKSVAKTDEFVYQSGCTVLPISKSASKKDQIRVRVRRPGRPVNVFFVDYPTDGLVYTLNLFSLSNGALRSEVVATSYPRSDRSTTNQPVNTDEQGQG